VSLLKIERRPPSAAHSPIFGLQPCGCACSSEADFGMEPPDLRRRAPEGVPHMLSSSFAAATGRAVGGLRSARRPGSSSLTRPQLTIGIPLPNALVASCARFDRPWIARPVPPPTQGSRRGLLHRPAEGQYMRGRSGS